MVWWRLLFPHVPMPSLLSLLLLDERRRKLRHAGAWFLFALILVIGAIPGARRELGTVASGLVLHGIAYSVLTVLLFTGGSGSRNRRALKAVFIVLLMGAADELVQSLLPYRRGAVLDWTVDAAASIVSAALLRAFLPDPGSGNLPRI